MGAPGNENRPYSAFATIYAREFWPNWSLPLVPIALEICCLRTLDVRWALELACGIGDFSSALASEGIEVMGLDISPQMIELARAKHSELADRFVVADMREFDLGQSFDLATCWFDSLNYVQTEEDVLRVFRAVRGHLSPGGVFLFDVNTLKGFKAHWTGPTVFVGDDYALISSASHDANTQTAEAAMTGFVRLDDGCYARFEERHAQKAYSLETLTRLAEEAGLSIGGTFSREDAAKPTSDEDDRLFVIAEAGKTARRW